jgi:hypothetical protein
MLESSCGEVDYCCHIKGILGIIFGNSYQIPVYSCANYMFLLIFIAQLVYLNIIHIPHPWVSNVKDLCIVKKYLF